MNFGFNHGFASSSFDPDSYRIVTVTETVEGYCEYSAGGTCVATSTLVVATVNAGGAETFTWSVDAGVIVSGQGTSSVVVETDADADVAIVVTCEASDTVAVVSKGKTITQTHKQELVANGVTYLGDTVTHLGVPVTFNPGVVVLNQVVHNGQAVVHNGVPIVHT